MSKALNCLYHFVIMFTKRARYLTENKRLLLKSLTVENGMLCEVLSYGFQDNIN